MALAVKPLCLWSLAGRQVWREACASQRRNSMLRITVHEEGRQCRLELAGRLCGPWVGETENVWRSARCSGKQIEVDMREVTGVDDAGRTLLAVMHQSG